MIEPGRILQPLDEAADDIARLSDYETAAELATAVAASFRALERSLRRLLRADPEAPEEVRLSALSSADLPLRQVIDALRQRELISLHMAGAVHELSQISQRAEAGQARPADADAAQRAVDRLRSEVHELPNRPARTAARPAAEPAAANAEQHEATARGRRFSMDRRRWVIAGVAALVLVGAAGYLLYAGRESPRESAVEAFAAGRTGIAEQGFRDALREDPDDVTSMLYLGRIYRRQGRLQEAAGVLREAARRHPEDADVRRELGHLLMSLGRPESAVEQYRRAVDLAPQESSGWIGLVSAMRAAGDARSETVLQRAPADVRAALGGGSP